MKCRYTFEEELAANKPHRFTLMMLPIDDTAVEIKVQAYAFVCVLCMTYIYTYIQTLTGILLHQQMTDMYIKDHNREEIEIEENIKAAND